MSPIDKIKDGIINNDMEKIIEGFRLLTGEEVKPEKETTTQRIGTVAADGKEETIPVAATEDYHSPSRSKDLDFSTKPREEEDAKYGKHEPIVVGENQFVDDGTEDMDVKTPDVGRTTRRPPVKMVEVQCHACGGKEMINAQYKSGEFHRCGKCVG